MSALTGWLTSAISGWCLGGASSSGDVAAASWGNKWRVNVTHVDLDLLPMNDSPSGLAVMHLEICHILFLLPLGAICDRSSFSSLECSAPSAFVSRPRVLALSRWPLASDCNCSVSLSISPSRSCILRRGLLTLCLQVSNLFLVPL